MLEAFKSLIALPLTGGAKLVEIVQEYVASNPDAVIDQASNFIGPILPNNVSSAPNTFTLFTPFNFIASSNMCLPEEEALQVDVPFMTTNVTNFVQDYVPNRDDIAANVSALATNVTDFMGNYLPSNLEGTTAAAGAGAISLATAGAGYIMHKKKKLVPAAAIPSPIEATPSIEEAPKPTGDLKEELAQKLAKQRVAEEQSQEDMRQAEEAKRKEEAEHQAEAARQAELKRQAEAARQAELKRQAEAARQAELKRQAEAARQAELKRQAEAACQAELKRQAEAAHQAELKCQAEAARQAELERQVEELKRQTAELKRQEQAKRQAEEAKQQAPRPIVPQLSVHVQQQNPIPAALPSKTPLAVLMEFLDADKKAGNIKNRINSSLELKDWLNQQSDEVIQALINNIKGSVFFYSMANASQILIRFKSIATQPRAGMKI